MMRKLILFIGLLFCTATAHAAEMVNVEYIHKLIARDWGIEIPYNPALTNPKIAANMKYLLTAVDVANRELNGKETTEYGNGEYATMAAADTIATNDAVARLIRVQPKFFITTTSDTDSFDFSMSAAGTFTIDWGDGEVQQIVRDNTTPETYSHTYAASGKYIIGVGGKATSYGIFWNSTAISFANNANILSVDGSLGAIFSTIGDGADASLQPNFYQTFFKNTNLTSIPKALFAGITGPARSNMFRSTFQNCSNLQELPTGLFAGITGPAAASMFHSTFQNCINLQTLPAALFPRITAPAADMFHSTFQSCSNLQALPTGLFAGITGPAADSLFNSTFYGCARLTSLPSDLFSGITGPAATNMFSNTFNSCRGLTSLPSGLFSSITGSAAGYMFSGTFSSCSGLQSIPEKLFGEFSGDAQRAMFYRTFSDCRKLSDSSARINGKFLYEIWPSASAAEVGECYLYDTGLSDYDSIPDAWK